MKQVIKHYLAKRVARKLTPWLTLYGEKDTYTDEEITYALLRARLSKRYLKLAKEVFGGNISKYRDYGKQKYLKCTNRPYLPKGSSTIEASSIFFENSNDNDSG